MLAIVDNDVVVKLARFGLLTALESHLQAQKRTIALQPLIDGTLDLANKTGQLKKFTTHDQRAVAAALAAKVGRVTLNDRGKKLIELCVHTEGVDPGDAVWLAVGASTPGALICTGDKTALRGVARDTGCAEIVQALQGRVVCLEQIVADLIGRESIAIVRKGILAEPAADAAVASCFGAQKNQADSQRELAALIDGLRADTGGLLRP